MKRSAATCTGDQISGSPGCGLARRPYASTLATSAAHGSNAGAGRTKEGSRGISPAASVVRNHDGRSRRDEGMTSRALRTAPPCSLRPDWGHRARLSTCYVASGLSAFTRLVDQAAWARRLA